MIDRLYRFRDEKPGQWMGLVAFILAALALVIRLAGLGAESGWIDEAYSIILARYPIPQIIQGTAADQHPPLYYMVLHAWLWFGDGVPYARLLSVILGVVNVIQVLIFGRQIGGEKLGFGAALLLAISPFHVWYSQEVRQYMLLACLTTAATQELWQIVQGKQRWVWYWLFSILAIYTQYFAIFILMAHAILVGLWAWRSRNWRILIPWGTAMLGIGFAFAPWSQTAINQFLHHTMSWISDPVAGDVRDVALRILLGSGVLALPVALRWVGLFSLLGVFGWALLRTRSRAGNNRLGLIFLAIWALVPFVAISLVAIVYPVFQFKQYLILLAPFLLASTAMALVLPRFWGRIFYIGLVLAAGLTLAYQQTVLTKDDWRGVAQYLERSTTESTLVYGNPSATLLALELYLDKPIAFAGYPPGYHILTGGWEGDVIDPSLADKQLSNATQGYQAVWLVEFFPEFWDPQQYLASWLDVNGTLLDDQYFGNIHLRLFHLVP